MPHVKREREMDCRTDFNEPRETEYLSCVYATSSAVSADGRTRCQLSFRHGLQLSWCIMLVRHPAACTGQLELPELVVSSCPVPSPSI